jgi:hypothetical protein
VLGIPPGEVTRAQRQTGKGVTIGLLFGSGAAGLRDYLGHEDGCGHTRAEVGEKRHKFFRRWAGLRRRMEHPDNSGTAPRTIVQHARHA